MDLLPGGVAVPRLGGGSEQGGCRAPVLLFYVGGRLVAEGAPTTERKERGDAIVCAATLKSGFELSGSDPEGGTLSRSDVHVFAIYGDRASEIR